MRVLVSRLGAWGDCIIVTPLVRYLHNRGDEVYLLTSEEGMEVFKNNPHVAKLHLHEKDSIPNRALNDYFESIRLAWECDKHIGLSESIEYNLSLHPTSPRYKYPKFEKIELCNKNFYEETFRFAGIDQVIISGLREFDFAELYNPEMFFAPEEENKMYDEFKKWKDRFVIIFGLSGSARNKTYTHNHRVITEIVARHKDALVITVGDERCQTLEIAFNDKRIIKKSGIWQMRESILACKYANLVISPDTGLLHGSGCFETHKIGLLNHTTRENITKHFKNDYSLEAQGVECSPCFQLVYQSALFCNIDNDDERSALCMSKGLPAGRVIDRIEEVKNANR